MNVKARFIILIITGLILWGLIAREGKILVLSLPFLAYLIAGILYLPTRLELRAVRTLLSAKSSSPGIYQMRVTIENVGDACENLFLDDDHGKELEVIDGSMQKKTAIPSSEKVELIYSFQARRGLYAWKTIHAVVSDPFGLFEFAMDLPAPGEIHVPPERIFLRNLPLKPAFTRHSAGMIPARLAGPGIDFWGVREYIPGDSLRWLNWKMIARNPGKFFTKEFEREEIAEIGMILDARSLADCQIQGESLFERSVQAALSLSEVFLKDGNRLGLLIFGKTISTLFPGYGKRQLHQIRRKLAGASADSNLSLSYLHGISSRLFPARSLLVLISPLDSRDRQVFQQLQAAGYQVLLLSPDPVDFFLRRTPSDRATSLAGQAARLERFLLLKQLMRSGIQVINWQVDRPLNETIDLYLHHTGWDGRHRR